MCQAYQTYPMRSISQTYPICQTCQIVFRIAVVEKKAGRVVRDESKQACGKCRKQCPWGVYTTNTWVQKCLSTDPYSYRSTGLRLTVREGDEGIVGDVSFTATLLRLRPVNDDRPASLRASAYALTALS